MKTLNMTRLQKLAALMLMVGLALSVAASPVAAQADSRYFPQTGYSVSGKFLQYWQTNGGLATYGYPITDAQPEVDPETGRTFLTQWFERNRFELHPEYAGTQYEVLLGLLGKDLKREALVVDPHFSPATPLPAADQRFFPAVRHNLGGAFRPYWENNGGLTRFGYPLSEEYREIDPQTGQVFTTQWFERARFEYHPQNQPPYDVLLGLLGNQLKVSSGHIEAVWQIPATGGIATESLFLGDGDEGHLYQTDHYHSLIVQYSSTGLFQSSWPVARLDPSANVPEQVATDTQGNFYVIVRYGSNQSAQRLDKYDRQGRYVTTLLDWKPMPKPDGSTLTQEIHSLKLDRQNNIYLLKSARVFPGSVYSPIISSTVNKYSPDGKLLLTFGQDGNGDGQFAFSNAALGLVVDGERNIYVADPDNQRVEKFDQDGKFLAKLGGAGSTLFSQPVALAVDRQDNLYVADLANSNVQKFGSAGQFLARWGVLGGGEGEFDGLFDIAIDRQNNIFVGDGAVPDRVQKFRQR